MPTLKITSDEGLGFKKEGIINLCYTLSYLMNFLEVLSRYSVDFPPEGYERLKIGIYDDNLQKLIETSFERRYKDPDNYRESSSYEHLSNTVLDVDHFFRSVVNRNTNAHSKYDTHIDFGRDGKYKVEQYFQLNKEIKLC